MGVRFGREGDEWRSKQASAALVKYALGAYLWISERESDRDTKAGGQR